MTEAEWLACGEPKKMLEFLMGRPSTRKFRLFAVACCRKITPLMLKSKLGYRAVVIAEKLADGLPVVENIAEFRDRLAIEDYDFARIDHGPHTTKEDYVIYYAAGAACYALEDEGHFLGKVAKDYGEPGILQVPHQAALAAAHWERKTSRHGLKESGFRRELRGIIPIVHEIFGNPFRPPPPLPAVSLDWNDGTVRRIAQAIYEERAFDRLPILADALEEAGCTDADILNHCRQPGEHVRGCWVIDLIRGAS
jgi:hypothetical protein